MPPTVLTFGNRSTGGIDIVSPRFSATFRWVNGGTSFTLWDRWNVGGKNDPARTDIRI